MYFVCIETLMDEWWKDLCLYMRLLYDGLKVSGNYLLDSSGYYIANFNQGSFSINGSSKFKDDPTLVKEMLEYMHSISASQKIKRLAINKADLINLAEFLMHFHELEDIEIVGCTTNGFPDFLQSFRKLRRLRIVNCRIPRIPEWIADFKNMISLDIALNQLEDLPDSFNRLYKLEKLNLSYNRFMTFPNIICSLEKLRGLYIHNNMIHKIPREIRNLQNLSELNLSENCICHLSIDGLFKLQALNIKGNFMIELPNLDNFPFLSELYVGGNHWNDQSLKKLMQLHNNGVFVSFEDQ